ncbi:amino acid permease [Aspergillus rambellii]|uniref:Amino acid permease n=1 Tax=Aspergillus rambellii TaxID=308745 RepID=A0A0F8X012_9EURO|nr:amino acid permease [Aspergillus rambellii]
MYSGFSPGLRNGGPAALVWGMVLSMTGTMALALSLGEMASICPLAGAQYHWTALLAPPKIRVFTTWMQGWITVFGWQAAVTSICFLVATQIQGLIILNHPEYNPQRWHGTLLMWAVMLFSFSMNVFAVQILPLLQLFGGLMHVVIFIVLVVPLVLLSPRSTARFVFTDLLNQGGWSSDGVSWCLGMLTVTYCFTGFDGAIHMSEEVRNPARVIPRILIQTIAINGTLAFVFTLVLLFCIGDVSNVLHTSTGFPIIAIFHQTTGSVRATTVMQLTITILGFVSNIAVVASVSRLTWAFARDGGLPYSKFFAKVDGRYQIPFRAVCLVCFTAILLSLINIASTTALSAILALTTSSLFISYLIPIFMMTWKRLRKEPINFGPWTLGRWGLAINIYAIVFGLFTTTFVLFPTEIPVTATNMNYSGPVFLGLILHAGQQDRQ